MVMKSGFIGLGGMGQPMAMNLAREGLLQFVWNRTEQKALNLSSITGVEKALSPGDLASSADVIFICVSADKDVLDVLGQIEPKLRPGSIVVDFSTTSPLTAMEASKLLSAKGTAFLDAPVTGGVEGARNGSLSIMIGGQVELITQLKPYFDAVGRRVIHMGSTGMGQAAKAVNQVMCAGINQAVCESLYFGEQLGLDPLKLIEAVSGGAAGNWFLEKRGPTMVQNQFNPGFKVALHLKDLNICLDMADNIGVELELTKMTRDHYLELLAGGFDQEDISALYRLKKS